MRPFLPLLLLLSLLTAGTLPGAAQERPARTRYLDLLTVGQQVWALAQDGSIRIIDLDKGADAGDKRQLKADAFCRDARNNVILLQGKQAVLLPGGAEAGRRVVAVKPAAAAEALGIVSDSRGNLFTIKPTGIASAATGKLYFPRTSLNGQIRLNNSWGEPAAFFIDRVDRIWVGFGYGEWGGNLFVFDTRKNAFVTPELGSFRLELNPVMSFFEGDSTVYLSCGLHHFFAHGCIVGFKQLKARLVLESQASRDSTAGRRFPLQSGEYIGPGAFSAADQALYFYSQHGIFKGSLSADLSKLANWTNVAQPKLHWGSGQKNAVGSPMNVHKMLFTAGNQLVFLPDAGIGVLAGSSLRLFD
jgi:hypothetical protein